MAILLVKVDGSIIYQRNHIWLFAVGGVPGLAPTAGAMALLLRCTCTLQFKILYLKFSFAVLSLAMFNFDLHRFQSLCV